jgi:putative peptidoglycan lipid II flippase
MPRGSVTSLYYADRIMQLVLGSFAVAVATAIMPMMARQAKLLDYDAVKKTLGFSIRIVSFVTFPATMGIILLRQPIIRVLFQHGQFVAESTRLTAWALAFYALGLPAISAIKIIVQAFYSTRDTKTPVWTAAGVLLLNIVLNTFFLILFFPQLQNGGPALATAISAYVNCVVLFMVFRGRYGRFGGWEILASSAKALTAAAFMGAIIVLALQYGHLGAHPSLAADASLLAATIGGACAAYLFLTWVFRSPELREVYEILFHRQAAANAPAGAI